MRLHPMEVFGFTGQAVSGALFFFTDHWIPATIITLVAAVPLFVGQQIRHRQEMDELRRRFP